MKILAGVVFVESKDLVALGVPYGSITNGVWRNRQGVGRKDSWVHYDMLDGLLIRYGTIPKNTCTRYGLPSEADMLEFCTKQNEQKEATDRALQEEFKRLAKVSKR